jgi:hypothetical protein
LMQASLNGTRAAQAAGVQEVEDDTEESDAAADSEREPAVGDPATCKSAGIASQPGGMDATRKEARLDAPSSIGGGAQGLRPAAGARGAAPSQQPLSGGQPRVAGRCVPARQQPQYNMRSSDKKPVTIVISDSDDDGCEPPATRTSAGGAAAAKPSAGPASQPPPEAAANAAAMPAAGAPDATITAGSGRGTQEPAPASELDADSPSNNEAAEGAGQGAQGRVKAGHKRKLQELNTLLKSKMSRVVEGNLRCGRKRDQGWYKSGGGAATGDEDDEDSGDESGGAGEPAAAPPKQPLLPPALQGQAAAAAAAATAAAAAAFSQGKAAGAKLPQVPAAAKHHPPGRSASAPSVVAPGLTGDLVTDGIVLLNRAKRPLRRGAKILGHVLHPDDVQLAEVGW